MWGLMAGQLLQGVMNIYGARAQGKAQAASYKFSARQDEENARASALEYSIAEDSLRKKNRKALSELEARQAENGLAGGTFDRVLENSAENLEQDALNLRYQGLSTWANYKNSAALNRYGAAMSRVNATTNMWSQGLNTAVNLLGTYAMYGGKSPAAGTYKTMSDPLSQNIQNYARANAPWTGLGVL